MVRLERPARKVIRLERLSHKATQANPPSQGKGLLRDNLFRQNGMFQAEQKGKFDALMDNDRSGIKSKEAF